MRRQARWQCEVCHAGIGRAGTCDRCQEQAILAALLRDVPAELWPVMQKVAQRVVGRTLWANRAWRDFYPGLLGRARERDEYLAIAIDAMVLAAAKRCEVMPPEPFLYVVARHAVLDALKSRAAAPLGIVGLPAGPHGAGAAPVEDLAVLDTEAVLERNRHYWLPMAQQQAVEDLVACRQVLRRVPARTGDTMARWIAGYTPAEIAVVTGRALRTVERDLAQVRHLLRAEGIQHGQLSGDRHPPSCPGE